jgi:putative (di)nucleoside polyphosphate hydrolase
VIDPDGFRPNVGIILSNPEGQLLWARRVGQDAWQFPQGGMRSDETPAEAMYRELAEEVGLCPEQVEVMGATRGWLRYRLPRQFIRHTSRPLCIGQKQVWFMLRILCADRAVCLDRSDRPEFDHWRWVDYWQPLNEVVSFKRNVYKKALHELAPLLFPDGVPACPKKTAHRARTR